DLANNISSNAGNMARVRNAGCVANLFTVNPTTLNGGSNLTRNLGGTTYNGLQLELRRRFAKGVLMGASYTWSHSLSTAGLIRSIRDMENPYTAPSGFDIRHALKLNWIYELPIGGKHHLLGNVHAPVLRTAISGWQFSGVSRVQSGTPSQLLGGRGTA